MTKPKDYDNGINYELKLKKNASTVIKKSTLIKRKSKKTDGYSGMNSPTKKSTHDLGVLSPNMEVKKAQIEQRKKATKNKSLSKFMKKSEFDEVDFLKNLDSIQEYTEKKTELIKSSYS